MTTKLTEEQAITILARLGYSSYDWDDNEEELDFQGEGTYFRQLIIDLMSIANGE